MNTFQQEPASVSPPREPRDLDQGAGGFADEGLDIGRIVGVLIDHLWIIVATVLVAGLVAFVMGKLEAPVYQGDALIQIERRSNVSPLENLEELYGGSGPNTSAEIQILQSRMVLGQVVDRIGLDLLVAPKGLPVVGTYAHRVGIERPSFFSGSASVWGGETLQVGRLEVEEGWRGRVLSVRSLGGERFEVLAGETVLGAGSVGERLSLADGAVDLRIASLEAPEGAVFEVQRLPRPAAISRLKGRLSVSEVGGGRGGSGMLQLRLTGTDREEVRRTLDAVAQTFLTENVEREAATVEQSLEFMSVQLPKLQQQLTTAEDELNLYRSGLESVDLTQESSTLMERSVELEQQLRELEFQEAELAQLFTASHPQYQSLLRQKAFLEEQRDELGAQIDRLPEEQQELLRMMRNLEVTQAIYVNMLNKAQELEIVRAGTVGNVRIVDSAAVGSIPISPNVTRMTLVGIFLGGALAVGLILLRDMLIRGIETPDQIEEIGLSVYATVPASDRQRTLERRASKRGENTPQQPRGLLANSDPTDTAVEALRGLRTSLHFAMLESTDRRLVITGPSPGVGKSFISANLSVVCAQIGQRVLVIDGDLRRGHLHDFFGGERAGGLSEHLAGDVELQDAVRRFGDGVHYIPRGISPPNPAELLMSDRFRELLDAASERYDLVIVDTPPALAVTDAAIISALSSATLLVTRFRQNHIKELNIARRRLEDAGARVRGVILNAVERRASTYYGYYGYGGYYGYSYKQEG